MIRIELAVLLTLLCARASAQTGVSASSSTDGQPTIKLESRLEPDKPALARDFETGTASRDKRFQRFLYDKTTHEYFGYSLTMEKVSSSETRITLGALSLNPAEKPISDVSARLMPSPVFPPPQVVHFGEKVAVSFFENPKTGQQIVDYLWLERKNCDGEAQKADCLEGLLADANADLQRVIQEKIAAIVQEQVSRRVQQEIQDKVQKRIDERMQKWEDRQQKKRSLQQSEQSWEIYRDQTCGSLPDVTKQSDCKLKLTRSHIHDMEQIY